EKCEAIAEFLVQPAEGQRRVFGHGTGNRSHCQQQRPTMKFALESPVSFGRKEIEVGQKLTRLRTPVEPQVFVHELPTEVVVLVVHFSCGHVLAASKTYA